MSSMSSLSDLARALLPDVDTAITSVLAPAQEFTTSARERIPPALRRKYVRRLVLASRIDKKQTTLHKLRMLCVLVSRSAII